mmetsp:Transcript_9850/g.39889  ORF Transcript_9850/g.39889 Transcript_9850/m.39889 type:complete len:322 (+) Transcript_9850:180-1145(+)
MAPARHAGRLQRRTEGVQRGLHRPRAQPHVRAVHRGHERPEHPPQGRLQRRGDRHPPRIWHVRHGGGGATVRARREGARRPQRVLLLPVDRHLRADRDRVRGCRPQGHARHRGHRRVPPARQAPPGLRHRLRHRKRKAQGGLRAARRDLHRRDVPRRSRQTNRGRRASRRRRLRPRLHRVRHLLGRHESPGRRRRDHRAAEGLERTRVRRRGDALRARRGARPRRERDEERQHDAQPAQVARRHGHLRRGRVQLLHHHAHRLPPTVQGRRVRDARLRLREDQGRLRRDGRQGEGRHGGCRARRRRRAGVPRAGRRRRLRRR